MKNKAEQILEQYEKDGDYPNMKRKLLILFGISNSIVCSFCNETGFDKVGLKYHLETYCDAYAKIK